MTEEESNLSKYIKTLAIHANNYEYIFTDATKKDKKIPDSFLENYLDIIYEIEEKKNKLEKIKNGSLFKAQ
jgi:hypothetical protein